jgi:enediyne biosynthesis protein E4
MNLYPHTARALRTRQSCPWMRVATLLWLGCVAMLTTSCGAPEQPAVPAGIEQQALRPAQAASAGEPRFRLVPTSQTGLVFKNELRRENRYTYLTNGAGLAVGDYDGDGMLDCYLVSQDGANKLFRQVAPLQFEDVTQSAGNVDGGEAWGSGATFADVDGDGDLDLYVCNIEAKNLLYQNQGNGTFVEAAKQFGLDIVAASTMAAFADYDRDGKLDLYLLTNRALHAGWADTPEVLHGFRPPADTAHAPTELVPTAKQWQQLRELAARNELGSAPLPAELAEHFFTFRGKVYTAGQPDRLLRNVAGKFVDVTTSAGIRDQGMGLSATWCDYDNDGYPDLYVANDLESPDMLYHNEQNGTFREVTKQAVPHTAYYGMGSDAADVDGDGNFDFLVADMSMTTHKKAKILMGDMDEERPVLMHADPPQAMRNALLLNTGMGKFQEAAKLAGVSSTDWTWSVLFGDLDQDGRVDLFATNGIARFDTDPDLQLRVAELWRKGQQQAAIALIQNVAAVPEKNIALRNQSDLQFVKTGKEWGLDLEAVSHGAALADFDGDGDLDVLINNFEAPASLYENRTSDGKAIVVRLRGQRSERFGVGTRCVVQLPNGQRLIRELTLAHGYLSGHPRTALWRR